MERGSDQAPAYLEPTPPQNIESLLNDKFQELLSAHPTFTIDQVFYLQATRLYLQLMQKKKEVQAATEQVQQLKQKLGIEVPHRRRPSANPTSHSANENGSDKKKRSRRTAIEIARHYICTIDKCNKSYGSEGSLNQHIKMKHSGEYSKTLLMMDLGRSNSQ